MDFIKELVLVLVGAVIAGVVTITSCVIAYKSDRKKEEAERVAKQAELDLKNAKEQQELRNALEALKTAVTSSENLRDAKIEARLTALEKKLDEHNRYGDKIGSIQSDITEIKIAISRLEARTT